MIIISSLSFFFIVPNLDIKVINDQGREFTKENIKEILADRNFDFALAEAGVVIHHSYGYTKKQFADFANCFDRVLTNLLKEND